MSRRIGDRNRAAARVVVIREHAVIGEDAADQPLAVDVVGERDAGAVGLHQHVGQRGVGVEHEAGLDAVAGAAVAVAEAVVLVLGQGAVDAGLDQPVGLRRRRRCSAPLAVMLPLASKALATALLSISRFSASWRVVDGLGGEDRRQRLGAVLAQVIADRVERVAVGVDDAGVGLGVGQAGEPVGGVVAVGGGGAVGVGGAGEAVGGVVAVAGLVAEPVGDAWSCGWRRRRRR